MGKCITTGDSNVAIGLNAGCFTGSCKCNVFIGRYAGQMGGSSANIAIGLKAGRCIGGAQIKPFEKPIHLLYGTDTYS